MDVTYVLLATCKCCTLSSCHSHRMRLKKFYIYIIVIAHNPVNNRGNIEWVEWEITIFVEVGLRSLERHVVLMTDGRTSILQRCCCCCCWPHQAILSGCYWSAASVRRRVVDCRSYTAVAAVSTAADQCNDVGRGVDRRWSKRPGRGSLQLWVSSRPQ